MRSAANLVVAHVLRSQLLGFALANFLLSMYALWACITKVGCGIIASRSWLKNSRLARSARRRLQHLGNRIGTNICVSFSQKVLNTHMMCSWGLEEP